MLYSEPRFTKDLDIWVDREAGNAERVFRALAEFGAPLATFIGLDDLLTNKRAPARLSDLMDCERLQSPKGE
jgi:hypothetical protein